MCMPGIHDLMQARANLPTRMISRPTMKVERVSVSSVVPRMSAFSIPFAVPS